MTAETVEILPLDEPDALEASTAIASVWDSICKFDSLRAPGYKLIESGGSSYVLLVDGKKPVAIKVPRLDVTHNRATGSKLLFETLIACHLAEASPPADLTIPTVVDSSFECRTPYVAFDIAPGEVLGYSEVNVMSPAEKRLLGAKLGAFVGWMGNTMSFDDYQNIRAEAGTSVFDRLHNKQVFLECANISRRLGCAALSQAHQDVWEALMGLDYSEIHASTIGHDDLRPDNLSFERVDGLWQPAGVIDFGLVKPTSPARDLRFMSIVGDEAAEAAAEAYEAQTGHPVSIDLMNFWAEFQVVTQTVSGIAHDLPSSVANVRPSFDRLIPGEDWSELDRFCS